MGRKRVVMKRIEDRNSRHVAFSKRRNGLMKKASELSVLCDVEVAVIVFSGNGRLYEFSSSKSLAETLERYQTVNINLEVAAKEAHKPKKHHTECSGPLKVAELLKVISDLKVEELTPQQLIHLERDLSAISEQTRRIKTQLLMETITAHAEKVNKLTEENHQLLEDQIKTDGNKRSPNSDRDDDGSPKPPPRKRASAD